VNFADRINKPLLMAYGRNDPRVKIEHAYAIEGALKRAGRPYQLMIVNDEGHGFRKEENRVLFFEQVDAFLKQYIRTDAR
jgi:dipeptidyl aminopeptidase/acylaminoacyl peptidase